MKIVLLAEREYESKKVDDKGIPKKFNELSLLNPETTKFFRYGMPAEKVEAVGFFEPDPTTVYEAETEEGDGMRIVITKVTFAGKLSFHIDTEAKKPEDL